jgi:ERCC4-type nuclease
MIIADIYEPDKLKGAADKVENIQADYMVVGEHKKYVIERKTWTDLLGSIKEGRIWDQLRRLKNLEASDGYQPRLIIEGYKFMLFKYKRVGKAQLEGLLTAIVDFGVPILYAETQDATILQLNILNNNAGEAKEFIRPTIAKTGRTKNEEKEDVLAAVDCIGRKTAKKLLKHFGNIREVVNSDQFYLSTVIGAREAQHFTDVITQPLDIREG